MKQKTLPYISVVIPAYNEEKYLPACLQTLTTQTYPSDKYEIIVSNNNSTDKTAQIAKKYGARVVPAKDQGYVYALNTGLSHAKGEIIACTDADSFVPKTWLEQIAKQFLKNTKVSGLTGGVETDIETPVLRFLAQNLYSLFMRITFAIGFPNLTGFNMAFRADKYKEVGGIDLDYKISADVEIGKRLKKVGLVKFVPHIAVKTSTRRWKHGVFRTLKEYAIGYIYTNILMKAPPVKQKVYR